MNTYCAHPLINAQVERLPGNDITRLLREGQAQEISVNADGRIRIDDSGPWEYLVDADPIPPAFAETAIRLITAVNNIWINPDAPFVDTMLACGARFSASISPIADGVQFTIRTHARIFRPLTASMTAEQAQWTWRQIVERKNIAGKTTLVNSIVAEVPAQERLDIIEDVTELQIPKGHNVIRRLTNACFVGERCLTSCCDFRYVSHVGS